MVVMEKFLCLALVICAFTKVITLPTNNFAPDKCGYQSCNPVKDDMINVHLVPHTHDDVGWLKTVDQYYYGNKNDIQYAEVQFILDSVIQELMNDPTKRFIYVEIAFFSRWWNQQMDSMRHQVKQLVQQGRLEFILGGWCMNDEASTHYNAIIDQHSYGFEFLRENFGDCARPRVAWQIDPFGHSREQASLFAQMGFDGLFFGRLDYQDKDTRLQDKTMEMVWKGSPDNLGPRANLFTGALYNGYNPPDGFCFDTLCTDDPVMDDPRLHDYNKDQKVMDFLKAVADQVKNFRTNHIIMTMGSDFQYSNAHTWYKNLDKLIKYTNELQANGSKVNLLYSTPSCYLYQLNRANLTWTTKSDDFFPYAHRANTFWSGYFTSRPALKHYVRRTNNFLQVSKQMDALAMLEDWDNSTYNLRVLMEAMGVAQHHDAVSGTEKQAVAYDYAMRLAYGVSECEKVINDAYSKLLPKASATPPGMSFCHLMNISVCATTEAAKQFQVHVYNPHGRSMNHYIRIPVIGRAYTITGPNGEQVDNEVFPITPDNFRIPERNGSMIKYMLVFLAKLPPLGFSTYFFQMTAGNFRAGNQRPERKAFNSEFVASKGLHFMKDTVMDNGMVSLSFDTTGHLKSMTNIKSGLTVALMQDFLYYYSHAGNNSQSQFQASGAYIFRPNASNSQAHSVDSRKITTKLRSYKAQGKMVQEMYQEFAPWVTQTVRLYDGLPYAEFEWTVGPLPINDGMGRELIARYTTDMASQATFYTDANGREILKRVRDYRPTWKLNQTEPVAGNYYPVNSRIFIQDQARNIQLTVLTDRSQGGSSLKDGSVELMVHRRMLHDDALGVGEALNETGSNGQGLIVRGCHYVLLDKIPEAAAQHRSLAMELYMAPQVSFTTAPMTQQQWSQTFRTTWSGMQAALPDNIHLLTLEQFPALGPIPTKLQPFLMRLEHFYERGEDVNLSMPVTLDLRNLFAPFHIVTAAELTLGANMPLRELKRLNWKTNSESQPEPLHQDNTLFFRPVGDPFTVTMKPMEIRTFQVEVST